MEEDIEEFIKSEQVAASFAPFVGISGHGQSCLFACAFLHMCKIQ